MFAASLPQVDDKEVMLLGFEKYYYRTGNQATLTVLITEGIDHQIFVDAVSGGTSQGVLFKFDWGASKNFTKIVYDLLRPLRFDIKDSH